MNESADPGLIYDLYTGAFRPQIIRLALQLDVFTPLAGRATAGRDAAARRTDDRRAAVGVDGDHLAAIEGRPLSNELPVVAATTYRAQTPDGRLRARRDDVRQALGRPDHLLVDARSPEMFSGADRAGAARGGRIPGAINLPARRETHGDGAFKAWRVPTVREDGTFKPAVEMRALIESLGIMPKKRIITYCVRGGLSTHTWFVLTQLLGYPDVAEYDRSWAEWGNVAGLPIAEG